MARDFILAMLQNLVFYVVLGSRRVPGAEKLASYNNQLAVRIFQKNTSAVRIFQNAKQFELEYSETLAVRIFQNSMHCRFKFNVFFPF